MYREIGYSIYAREHHSELETAVVKAHSYVIVEILPVLSIINC
jgi:hypothetical protein